MQNSWVQNDLFRIRVENTQDQSGRSWDTRQSRQRWSESYLKDVGGKLKLLYWPKLRTFIIQ